MADDTLNSIRKTIDKLDQTIIDALGERQRIVRDVLSDKLENSKEIRDHDREEEMMESIREKATQAGMDPYFLEQLFREVISHSVRYQTHALVDHQNKKANQTSIKVAYQGTDGAFSHQTAMRHFEQRYDEVICIGFTRFDQAAEAVGKGDADVAMLPIENTTAGSINDTYDLLAEKDLFIIGEEVLQVNHCLMAPEHVELSNMLGSHQTVIYL